MNSIWYWLTSEDYQTIIKNIKDTTFRNKLYNQYISKIPMLKTAYERLKKQYQ